jgi:DNA-binding HxlR family transcriptional regulator
MSNYSSELCPHYHAAVEIVGMRWAGAILQLMLAGATRFAEIERAIPDISSRMLSQRLKELEAEGIIERTVIPEMPVRIEYRLTPKGRALSPVVKALSAWADQWIAPEAAGAAERQNAKRRKRTGRKRA